MQMQLKKRGSILSLPVLERFSRSTVGLLIVMQFYLLGIMLLVILMLKFMMESLMRIKEPM